MSQVVIYTSNTCPYCITAKQLLTRKNQPFTEINIEQNSALADEMIQKSNRRTVPQIFINDQHIGGCDDLLALDRSGQLDKLLNQ